MTKVNILFIALFLSVGALVAQEKEESESFYRKNLTNFVDARLDFAFQDYEQNIDGAEQDYKFQYADFNFLSKGMITENFGFEFMIRFNSNNIDNNNLLDNVKRANLRYTSDNKKWFFSAGRYFMNVGSAENLYWGNQVYNYSFINNNLAVYKTGVTAQYTTNSNQTVGLQIVNSDVDNDMEFNTYWYGDLFNGLMQPMVSYTFVDNNDSAGVTQVAEIGAAWRHNKWQLDTDFIYATNGTYLFDVGEAVSVPIMLVYKGTHFRPHFKYIFDDVQFEGTVSVPLEDGSTSTVSSERTHTFELGLEYYPFEGKDFQFHLVGSAKNTNNNLAEMIGDNSDARQHYNSQYQILAGFRLRFDALRGL